MVADAAQVCSDLHLCAECGAWYRHMGVDKNSSWFVAAAGGNLQPWTHIEACLQSVMHVLPCAISWHLAHSRWLVPKSIPSPVPRHEACVACVLARFMFVWRRSLERSVLLRPKHCGVAENPVDDWLQYSVPPSLLSLPSRLCQVAVHVLHVRWGSLSASLF